VKQSLACSKIIVAWDEDENSASGHSYRPLPIFTYRPLIPRGDEKPFDENCLPSPELALKTPLYLASLLIRSSLSFPLAWRTSIPSFDHTLSEPTETRFATASAACYFLTPTNLVVLISICELPISTSVHAMPNLVQPHTHTHPNPSFQTDHPWNT
jgi:hypothetical protein